MIIFISAALLSGIASTGVAVARDRSDRSELTANQMADRADAQTAKLKVDLNLTADQEKNWSGFASAMQDMSRKQADRRIAVRDARAQQGAKFDVLDEMRKSADAKLADAAQPLYATFNEQQKQRFAETMFGGDRERETY
jgi:hypothetical protein